jgi:hypothetical protein
LTEPTVMDAKRDSVIRLPKRRDVLAVTTHRINWAYRQISFRAEEDMSITVTAQSHPHQHPGMWLGAKIALALVAVLLFSLTAAGLETRYGVSPSAETATSWVMSGE